MDLVANTYNYLRPGIAKHTDKHKYKLLSVNELRSLVGQLQAEYATIFPVRTLDSREDLICGILGFLENLE